jgi:hypothetical protein
MKTAPPVSQGFFTRGRLKVQQRLKYIFLLAIKAFSRLFYRLDIAWVGSAPENPWENLRLLLILNHTSLYEPLFAGGLPNSFLKQIAEHGLIPIADITLQRPIVGRFFRMVAKNVVSITRMRDKTWEKFCFRVRPESLVIMLPEGRMKRCDGLDAEGKPMTVRGGVADLLRELRGGEMVLAYSGGLHHVQAPGQFFPRLFKTLHMRLERLDIDEYRRTLLSSYGEEGFKRAVICDLEHRRNRYCPGYRAHRTDNAAIPRYLASNSRNGAVSSGNALEPIALTCCHMTNQPDKPTQPNLGLAQK